ncbi:hypothetical protein [Desulfosporosinus sp. Sb-LF]|uniref:hypothetical protein n=1 Tax=Desulfosporosinus sp. Sb-LF TaxID=2560027 RepID=UPI00107F43AC|nr:hypothetical protein [Desulfosporosinus sp. Sb-LF]TGE34196.1 hypothetical protein E4K68_00345 [Desulfosporosinus sp. Sb-LF]
MREKVQFNFAARWEAEMATVFAPAGSFRRPSRIIVLGASGGIVLLVLACLPWGYHYKLNYDLQAVNQKISAMLPVELQVKKLNDLKTKVQAEKQFLETVINDNYDPIIVLNQLKTLLPAGTEVHSFAFGSDKKVNISLTVTGPLDLARLWVSLQNSGVFEGVNIQSVSLEEKVQNLSLSLTYNGTVRLNNNQNTDAGDPTKIAPQGNTSDSKSTTEKPKAPPVSKPASDYPGIPQHVNAIVQGPDKVVVDWDRAINAITYNVYRATSPEGDYIKVANVTVPHFEDNGLANPLTYYYKIKSVSKNGIESSFDNPVGVTGNIPEAPSGVSTIPVAPGQIRVTWNSVSSATAYKVYRGGAENGPFVIVGIVTETKLLDSGLPVGIYYYKVSSLSENLEGPCSALDSVALVNGK